MLTKLFLVTALAAMLGGCLHTTGKLPEGSLARSPEPATRTVTRTMSAKLITPLSPEPGNDVVLYAVEVIGIKDQLEEPLKVLATSGCEERPPRDVELTILENRVGEDSTYVITACGPLSN